MPNGKMISFQPGEYPDLDGLPEGTMVKFEGEGRLTSGGMEIVSFETEAENEATRELKSMTKNDSYAVSKEQKGGGF